MNLNLVQMGLCVKYIITYKSPVFMRCLWVLGGFGGLTGFGRTARGFAWGLGWWRGWGRQVGPLPLRSGLRHPRQEDSVGRFMGGPPAVLVAPRRWRVWTGGTDVRDLPKFFHR